MYASLNQHQPGTFPSNTIQNSKNDNHCLAITSQNGKANLDPPMPMVDNIRKFFVRIEDKIKKVVINDEASQKTVVTRKRDEIKRS